MIQWDLKMKKNKKPIAWLPVDSRLFGPFLSFGHVRGIARLFLEVEIILTVAVVGGTVALVVLQLFFQKV